VSAAALATSVVIESIGTTALVQSGNDYYLNPVSSGTGPLLKIGGSAVVVGGAGTWTPIAAEQTAGGYDVAWHDSSSGQYSIWTTDSNGNFTSYLTGAVSGSSGTLENLENTFHQDLNGDGTIGVPAAPTTVTIESNGSTTFDKVGNNYFLHASGTANGPSLKFGGAAVTVGQAGTWSPIGGEQTASGYDVAWHDSSSGQYSIWTTDSNGNFTSYLTGAVSGTSTTLEALESTFHQDLNGDGNIGVVIESTGSTSLILTGSNYYLNASGSGPSLKIGGSLIVVGQAGTWSPIAAEQVSGGYDVAWKDSSSGQFSIWSTDSNGNFTAYLTGAVSGSSATLKSYEPIFHQDLNGDGATGAAPLATAKDEQFVFAAAASTAGQTTNTSLEDASAQKAATTNSVTTETIQDTALEPGGLTLAEYVAAHHLDHWIVT
jgi:serralysin